MSVFVKILVEFSHIVTDILQNILHNVSVPLKSFVNRHVSSVAPGSRADVSYTMSGLIENQKGCKSKKERKKERSLNYSTAEVFCRSHLGSNDVFQRESVRHKPMNMTFDHGICSIWLRIMFNKILYIYIFIYGTWQTALSRATYISALCPYQ